MCLDLGTTLESRIVDTGDGSVFLIGIHQHMYFRTAGDLTQLLQQFLPQRPGPGPAFTAASFSMIGGRLQSDIVPFEMSPRKSKLTAAFAARKPKGWSSRD